MAAFRRGGIPEILDYTCGRLAVPDHVGDLARAITEAAQLPRRAARYRAESACSEDRMVEQYLDLYSALAQEHAA